MTQKLLTRGAQAARKPRVTISDVADALGLTKGTVSRALNGYCDISQTTQTRVRRAAEAMGYRPLSHAQAIRTGRVRSIGLVLQISEPDAHRPFLADFIAGVSRTASGADWTLTIATASNEEATLRLLVNLAQEQKADGFILPRTYRDDSRVHALRDAQIPFVLYGRTSDTRGCAWFDIDGEQAMRDAVETLHALGHRRIGFIPGGAGYAYSDLRLGGYISGLQHQGIEFEPALIGLASVNRAEGKRAARKLLCQNDPPTAILCAVDLAAIGVYDAAAELGLRIGKELSVIAYDGIPEGELVTPPLSTFSVDTRKAGQRLTELLIKRIEGEAPETLRELAPATFQDRGSHGPARCSCAELAARIAGKLHPLGG